ncbi:galactose-1-phosphate uridylyltransferase [Chrysiogenes arsenatis]|uniref:galactose-1-phosphate uridylyltransferase n=1 Tax=Chrysiogenes arsenatis TaxID=309797 RepID=UPI00041C8DC5|nr:hypothetical protein [Chrysiogenes arsenatis]
MSTTLRRDLFQRFDVVYEPGVTRMPLWERVAPGAHNTTRPPHDPHCPFCPGNEVYASFTIAQKLNRKDGSWQQRVIPNRVPLFSVEGENDAHGDGVYDVTKGVGAHEILIESRLHNQHPWDMSVVDLETNLHLCAERMRDLAKDIRFAYISFSRHAGVFSGSGIAHPHTQIFALPDVPLEVRRVANAQNEYATFRNRCLVCDMIHQEREHRKRVIAENEAFLAIAPYASRCPFEMHLYPKKHQADFADLESGKFLSLASLLHECYGKLHRALGNPPFHVNLFTQSRGDTPSCSHWHIEILPWVAPIGSLTTATGIYMNPVTPEMVCGGEGSDR